MKLFVVALFLVVLLSLAAAPALALENATVSFIPDKISAEGELIVVASGIGETSTRVQWVVPVGEASGLGQLPKRGANWICEFSSTAANTCGPTPFTMPTTLLGSNYTLEVTAYSSSESRVTKLFVPVGNMNFTVNKNLVDTNLSLSVYTVPPLDEGEQVAYKVFYAGNFSSVGKDGLLTFQPVPVGQHTGNVILASGDYVISFTGNTRLGFGGTLIRVSVPVQQSGTPTTVTPTATALVTADPFTVRPVLKPNEQFRSVPLRVINNQNQPLVNVSFDIPIEHRGNFSIELDDKGAIPFTLGPLESKFVRWVIKNATVAGDFKFTVNIINGSGKLGEAKVDVSISILRESSSGLTISPEPFISGDFLLGNLTRTFDITNGGSRTATFAKTFSVPALENVATVTAPTVGAKETKQVTVTLVPLSPGRRSGVITLTAESGVLKVYVDVTFHTNVSSSLTQLRKQLDDLISGLSVASKTQLQDTVDEVTEKIEEGETAFGGGRYRDAETATAEASAMVAALEGVLGVPSPVVPTAVPSGKPAAGVDMTPFVLIAVLLVAVIVGLILFLRKRGKGGGDIEEIEKELKESGF